jgi:hypothetical protein
MKYVLFGLLMSTLSVAEAQTITAATCNESDVAKALSSINTDGTTVVVPAGNCTWTTPLSYTQKNSFTLQGAGAVSYSASSIAGTGTDNTIIQDNTGSNPVLTVVTIAGKTFRLTGIAFTYSSSNASVNGNGVVIVTGTSTSVRIDHNHFNQNNNVDLNPSGAVEGVIDHNQFDGSFADENMIRFQSGMWAGDSSNNGNGSWNDTDHFGTSQFMFAELNNFQTVPSASAYHIFAYDCSRAGRYVFRYNAVGYHVMLQTHGTSGGDGRGCRAQEIYENSFTYSSTPISDMSPFLLMMESGTGYIWGNTVTGFVTLVEADIPRTNTATYTQATSANGWGYCGTSYGPSPWDQNGASTGHQCIDAIGVGAGDLLSGFFPTKCNSSAGCSTYNGAWPHQAPDPVYTWTNTVNPVPQEPDHYWSNYAPVVITENVDYYLQLPNIDEPSSFNATAGTGSGTYAAIPTTCTPQVGYWATDANKFYICSARNTWTLAYTPYTYPHPLDLMGPSSPANPQAVVQTITTTQTKSKTTAKPSVPTTPK